MKSKNIIIRIISLSMIAVLITMEVLSYIEKGRITNISKFVSAVILLALIFISTFISRIDSTQKHQMSALFNKEVVYFQNDQKSKKLFYKGFRGWFGNNYAAAYYYLSKVTKNADDPVIKSKAYFYIGRCAVEEKKFDRARENLEQAVALNRNYGEAWSNLATVYLNLGEPQKAISVCETGIIYCANYANLYSKLAVLYLENEEYEQALKECLNAEQLEPNHAVFVMNTAISYAAVGDRTNADIKYNRAKLLGYKNCDAALDKIKTFLHQASIKESNRI